MIQKDIDTLEKSKSNKPEKYNILNILENVGSIFTGTYFHYKEVPKETIFERRIVERIKSRKGRLDEIERKEQNIINCLKNTLLIIKVQVICTQNESRQKMQK